MRGVSVARDPRVHDFIEDLPLDDARTIAVSQHGRADFVLDPIAQVWCDGRPTTHALDRQSRQSPAHPFRHT